MQKEKQTNFITSIQANTHTILVSTPYYTQITTKGKRTTTISQPNNQQHTYRGD